MPKKPVKIAAFTKKAVKARKSKATAKKQAKSNYTRNLENTIKELEKNKTGISGIPKKPYVKKTYTKKTNNVPYYSRKEDYTSKLKTNDIHFDEKIAKSDAILGQVSKGMDVVKKPINLVITLAQKFGKSMSDFGKFLGSSKKK